MLGAIYQSAVTYRHECRLSVITFISLRFLLQVQLLDFSIVNEQKRSAGHTKYKIVNLMHFGRYVYIV